MFNCNLLIRSQWDRRCKYWKTLVSNCCKAIPIKNISTSSAYIIILGGPGIAGRSFIYKLNSIGPRIDPAEHHLLFEVQLRLYRLLAHTDTDLLSSCETIEGEYHEYRYSKVFLEGFVGLPNPTLFVDQETDQYCTAFIECF